MDKTDCENELLALDGVCTLGFRGAGAAGCILRQEKSCGSSKVEERVFLHFTHQNLTESFGDVSQWWAQRPYKALDSL